MATDHWIYDTPPLSDVETKLRLLLAQLGKDNKLLGVQVCAYKDGKVIVDSTGGFLENNSDRRVQPDSLFPVFSVTKGITAGMLPWLIDAGKLKFEDTVASVWSEFGANGKDHVKVHHALNHTSGLGFKRNHHSKDKSLIGFGHSGMGGSTAFCDIQNKFPIAVTLNKMSYGAETAKIIQLVCSELSIPVPEEYTGFEASDAVLVN